MSNVFHIFLIVSIEEGVQYTANSDFDMQCHIITSNVIKCICSLS